MIDQLLQLLECGSKPELEVSRRTLLQTALLGTTTALVPSSAFAQPRSGKHDISYLWHPDLEAILDYREKVEELLGPEIARQLLVVKGRTNYGLIYDRDGSKEKAATTARHHTRILTNADLEAAIDIEDRGYDLVYNVSYGRSSNLVQLKRDFAVVQRVLGPEVRKNLYIEEKGNNDYILVYKRYGERDSTVAVAKKHDALLRKHGLSASLTPELNNPAVYDGKGESNERRERKKPERPKQKPLPSPQPTGGNLERAIEQYIQNYKKHNKHARDERTAWCVYDFITGEKVVSINEDVPLQAASMIKPLVALAYFHQVKDGKLTYTKEARRKMEKMIQKSSNSATNWVIDQVGGAKRVDEIIDDYYHRILPQTEVRERIPRGGATYRNEASAHDYSRFLHALWNNQLPYASEIRRLMALPGRDRIYTGVPEIPSGTAVYNKTGSTARLCGDMGILVADGQDGKEYPYIIIGIVEKAQRTGKYSNWIHARGNVIRHVSGMVYEHMRKKHGLV